MVGRIARNWRQSLRRASSRRAEEDDKNWLVYDGEDDFRSRTDVTYVRVAPHVTVIRDGAFRGCINLKAIDLSNATAIGAEAFHRCESLECIVVPSTVVGIGAEAFAYCAKLRSAELRTGLLAIGDRAFARCASLRRVFVPSTVATVGARAFSFCGKLKEAKLSEGLRTIDEGAFCCCDSLERVEVPSTVALICRWAFSNCVRLKYVELSDVATIGEGVFCKCHSLKRIIMPSSVDAIDISSHRGKSKKVRDAADVTTIGENAFFKCASLERIRVPSTVVAIGRNAFRGCTKLKEVKLCHEGVLEVGSGAFEDCPSLLRIDLLSTAYVVAPRFPGSRLLRSAVVSPTLGQMTIISSFLTKTRINRILHMSGVTWKEKLEQIRALYKLIDSTTILELAIWKSNIEKGNCQGTSEARQTSRKNAGADMNIIMNGVLPFLNAMYRD